MAKNIFEIHYWVDYSVNEPSEPCYTIVEARKFAYNVAKRKGKAKIFIRYNGPLVDAWTVIGTVEKESDSPIIWWIPKFKGYNNEKYWDKHYCSHWTYHLKKDGTLGKGFSPISAIRKSAIRKDYLPHQRR